MISRSDAISALRGDPFDLVVIGGGITGAGVALDAATRGYSVALVEKADFASGTSSRSSKLVHGGLRYLQQFDLGLVREALLERQLMVALAPYLVRPLQLVVAAFEGQRPDRLLGLGLNMYDVMSRESLRRRGRDANADGQIDWSPDRHRTIDGDEVVQLIPALAARTGNFSPVSPSRTSTPAARPPSSTRPVTSSQLAHTAPKRSASDSTVSTRRASSVWQS
jgi:glycerol-3-phosphate dehydrogenase